MRYLALFSFFVYMMLFVIGQRTLGWLQRVGRGNTRVHEIPLRPALTWIGFTLVSLGMVQMAKVLFHSHSAIRLTGAAIVISGLVLSLYSQYTLGDSWIAGVGVRKRHQLITNGPYRFVRHPMYTGMLISGAGACMCALNWIYGIGAMVFVSSFLVRCRAEESQLSQKLGPKYRQYAEQTGSLIPGIGRWKPIKSAR